MNAKSTKVSNVVRAAFCAEGKGPVPLHPHVILWCAVLVAGVFMAGMGAWAGTAPEQRAVAVTKSFDLAKAVVVQAAAIHLGKVLPQ